MSKIKPSNRYRFEVIGNGTSQNLVIFYYLHGQDSEYQYGIQVNGIANTLDGSNESEWINHIYKKLWVSNDMLYDIAKEINKLSPKNDIDWIKTFFMVEKYNYLNQNPLEEKINDTSVSTFDIVRSEIILSLNLAKDAEFSKKLTESVIERLKTENLI